MTEDQKTLMQRVVQDWLRQHSAEECLALMRCYVAGCRRQSRVQPVSNPLFAEALRQLWQLAPDEATVVELDLAACGFRTSSSFSPPRQAPLDLTALADDQPQLWRFICTGRW